ncbi:unnamed protein product [Gadus morhua 'NCC']
MTPSHQLALRASDAAVAFTAAMGPRWTQVTARAKKPGEVEKEARARVVSEGGDCSAGAQEEARARATLSGRGGEALVGFGLFKGGGGDSATQRHAAAEKNSEAHTEAWVRRSIHYLGAMEPGVVYQRTPPPKPTPDVPQYGWLLVVYCHDILSRLEEVKARVTSVF